MSATQAIAVALVVLAGAFLSVLGGAALAAPSRVHAFLGGFARSARAHYLELLARMLAGAAFVVGAAHMKFSALFHGVGWVVIATTLLLLLTPWQWHRRFAAWSVPHATRRLPLLALVSLAAGGFVLFSVVAR
jgi:hypothetical protein